MDQLPDGPSPHGGEAGDEETRGSVENVTSAPAYEPTGVEAVDRVLAEVAGVAEAPVGDHVAVFERAHDQLRRALDAQPGPSGGGEQGA
jgi:hypothetical protein